MSSIVFLNGDFCKEEDAKVSIFDRGYLFGDGIYEVVPVINGKVIDKAPFFERFDASLSKIGLKAPFCKAEIETILVTIVVLNGSLAAASLKASVANSSFTPAISYRILPGLISQTQYSTLPLPLPIRTSNGFSVIGLSGNTRIKILPPRVS